MTLHRGTSACPGVALAVAARLRIEYGVASFAPERLRRIAARLRAFGTDSPEPEQIILVADSLPAGFSAMTAGLEIVGIALASDTPLMPPPVCPTVVGLGEEFFETVLEDEIVIVDGSRGQVHTSPDALTLARCQLPSVRTRRIFLEEAHQAARTASDGRVIALYAPVQTPEEVSNAMRFGADGVCFIANEEFPWTEAEQYSVLAEMMEILGGLPLLLQAPPDRLALTALARASALGALHLIVATEAVHNEISARLAEVEVMLEEGDLPFGTPLFELSLSAGEDVELPDDLNSYSGVFVAETVGDAGAERLLPIAALAHRTRRPLMLSLDSPTELAHGLTLGATRILAPAEVTGEIKDAIREW